MMNTVPDATPNQIASLLKLLANGSYFRPYASNTIEVSFLRELPVYTGAVAHFNQNIVTPANGANKFVPFTEAEQAKIREALELISRVANVEFIFTDNPSQGAIRFGRAETVVDGILGGGANFFHGDDRQTPWVNDIYLPTTSLQLEYGRPGFLALLHEIGHALGLRGHPNESSVSTDIQLSRAVSMMSYADWVDSQGGLMHSAKGMTPLILDTLALQVLWGTPEGGVQPGDTVYSLVPDSVPARTNASPTNLYMTQTRTVFDSGGNDTFDASRYVAVNGPLVIDLRPGFLSSIGGNKNISIAFNSEIENARGGEARDTIVGNEWANKLVGNGGNDTLYGGAGKDELVGGLGADFLLGGAEDDVLDGGVETDLLDGGSGADTYKFSDSFGQDTIDDSDGQGKIEINGQALGPIGEMVGRYLVQPGVRSWTAKIGGQSYSFTVQEGTTGTGRQLVIQKGIGRNKDTANTITINHFDLAAATSDAGYLGVKLDTSADVMIAAKDAAPEDNPFLAADFDSDAVTGSSSITEGGGRSFVVYLNHAAEEGDTLVLHVAGLSGKGLQAVLGDETVDADQATISLAEGQTEVSFALVQDGAVDADTMGTLSVSYHAGGQDAVSNDWSLILKDGGEATKTLTGDILAKTEVATQDMYRTTRDGRRVLVARTGDRYFLSDNHWNLQDGGDVAVTNNVIFGTEWSDNIAGATGHDLLSGGPGNDKIDGGIGDDLIAGWTGHDTLLGGAGDDYIIAAGAASLDTQQISPLDSWEQWGLPPDATVIVNAPTWGVYKEQGDTFGTVSVVGSVTQSIEGDVIDGGEGNDHIRGGWGDDRIQGGEDNDEVVALAGDDIIEGNAGNDRLVGDGYSDTDVIEFTPLSSHGNDFMDGGEGDDAIIGQGGRDDLFGGDGADWLYGDSEVLETDSTVFLPFQYHASDYIDGEGGNDLAIAGGGDDTLYGGADDDTLWGDQDVGFLKNGAENDPLAWGNDYLDGEEGSDSLVGGGKDDTLWGGAGSDKLFGDHNQRPQGALDDSPAWGSDYLDGEEGDDTLAGGGRGDTLYGGDGNDVLTGDSEEALTPGSAHGADELYGEAGNDTMHGGGKDDVLWGGEGRDSLRGDSGVAELAGEHHGNDTLYGGAGDDQMSGDGGRDLLFGGDDDDVLYGDDDGRRFAGEFHGADTLDGGDGMDELVGGGGDDQLFGGAGDDSLYGDEVTGRLDTQFHGNDYLDGGAGADGLFAGSGDDTLDGGSGDDYFDVRNTSGRKTILDAEGFDWLDLGWDLNDIEVGEGVITRKSTGQQVLVEGLSASDLGAGSTIESFGVAGQWLNAYGILNSTGLSQLGTSGADALVGTAVRDVIRGFEGNDSIGGGGGNDELYGDDGDDALQGDEGTDVLVGGSGADNVQGGTGNDQVDGGEGDDQVFGGEGSDIVAGGAGDDQLRGGADDDQIAGHDGADALFGDDGDDFLTGGAGDDTLEGGEGHDTLYGDADNDLLRGGAGNDTLTGGDGDDRLEGGAGNDVYQVSNSTGTKTIVDGEGQDRLDLYWDPDQIQLIEGGIAHRTTGQQIRIQGFDPLKGSLGAIEQFTVSGGWWGSETLSAELFVTRVAGSSGLPLMGTEGADTLEGSAFSDNIQALAGDDQVSGGAGNDKLDGGEGNDALSGGEGADTLVGGAGRDSLDGGAGDDVYDLLTSTGDKVITDAAGSDRLQLGWRIDQMEARADGTLVNLATGQQVRLADWDLRAGAGPVESFDVMNPDQGAVVRMSAEDLLRRLTVRLQGTDQAEVLDGTMLRDVLSGGQGDDQLSGREGDDTLTGGAGNDVLVGGAGNDVYRIEAGDGADLLLDHQGANIIEFGAGLASAALKVRHIDGTQDLLLSFDGGPSVHVSGGLFGAMPQIRFADGTKFSYADLMGRVVSNGLSIVDDDASHLLVGSAGADSIQGLYGDDTLVGQAGADQLDGGDGDDVLIGGAGDDQLAGGAGHDRYRFARGDGQDRIDDLPGPLSLEFGPGIAVSDLSCQRVQIDGQAWLRLNYGAQDAVLIRDNGLDGLRLFLSGGATLTRDQLYAVALQESRQVQGTSGDDVLYGYAGNDTLDGGAGADVLRGGLGTDTYVMSEGSDRVQDGAGANKVRARVGSLAALEFARIGSDLLVVDRQNASTLRIEAFYGSDGEWALELDSGPAYDLRSEVAARAGSQSGVAERKQAFQQRALAIPLPAVQGHEITGPSPMQWTDASGNEYVVNHGVSVQTVSAGAGDTEVTGTGGTTQRPMELIRSETRVITESFVVTDRVTTTETRPGASYTVGHLEDGRFRPEGSAFSYGSFAVPPGTTVLENGAVVAVGPSSSITTVTETLRNETVTRTITDQDFRYTHDVTRTIPDVAGDAGPNRIFLNGSTVLVTAGGGNDLVERRNRLADDDLALPPELGDFVDGGAGDDVVRLGAGDDELSGGSGTDILDGGAGADTYVVSADDDGWDTIIDRAQSRVRADLNVGYGGVPLDPFIQAFESITGSTMTRYGDYMAQGTGRVELTRANLAALVQLQDLVRVTEAQGQAPQGGLSFYGRLTLPGRVQEVLDRLSSEGHGFASDADVFGLLGGAIDVVRFGPGVSSSALRVERIEIALDDGSNTPGVAISWTSANGERAGVRVALDPARAVSGYGIERFEFADGTSMTAAQILALVGTAPVGVQPGDALSAQQLREDEAFTWTLPEDAFTVEGGQVPTFRVTLANGEALPSWLQFDDQSRVFRGTPGNDQVGSVLLKVEATVGSQTAVQELLLQVANTNDAPVAGESVPAQTLQQGQGWTLQLPVAMFTDIDAGDSLSWSVTTEDGEALPAWLKFDGATRTLSATGAPADATELVLTVSATDTAGASASQLVTLKIAEPAGLNLEGSESPDVLIGSAGSDYIDGLGGADTMSGLGNDDVFVVDNSRDRVVELAGGGIDRVLAHISYTLPEHVENLTLMGTRNLRATGNTERNELVGNAGANRLDGSTGADRMLGGVGNDVYVVDDAGDVAVEQAGQGTDTVLSSVDYTLPDHVERLTLTGAAASGTGQQLDNLIIGNSGANRLSGLAGNDVLRGAEGDDELLGGDGNDRLEGGTGADRMEGGKGNDVYWVDETGDAAVELADGGVDSVTASIDYTLGENVERVTLTGAARRATGNAANNLLTGNALANVLAGLAGDDVLRGQDGDDELIGGDGNDRLEGGAGIDRLVGGVGNDTYVVDGLEDQIVEDAGGGTDTVRAGLTWTLGDNIEKLVLTGTAAVDATGNALANALYGNAASNTLSGLGGNDTLSGGAGADVLFGGEGNDRLDGGTGADRLEGGAGNDVYVVDDTGDVVIEAAGEGTDTVSSSIGGVLQSGVENLTLTGTAAIDGEGNVLGNVLRGNAGVNRLRGMEGNDTLVGDAGADILEGGMANDRLEGGLGGDLYLFGRGDGFDTLVENDATANTLDVLRFGSEIGADQLWLRREGNHLDVSVIGTADRVRITNWYVGAQHQVEVLELADGRRLLSQQVDSLVQAMSAFSPPAAGQTTLPANYRGSLETVLAANWQLPS